MQIYAHIYIYYSFYLCDSLISINSKNTFLFTLNILSLITNGVRIVYLINSAINYWRKMYLESETNNIWD